MGLHLNEGGDDLAENHEINVTPFIDVMLVLLIIFMVAAPLATVDIKVDLPASTAKPAPRPEKPVFVSVKADKKLYLGDDLVAQQDQLGAMLDAKTKGDKETTIFFQADKGVDYGDLMEVMNTMRAAGYLKVGLVGLETAAKK
ncbi:TonB system transport protein ExbD [Pseudomonas sichuanensis]|uniref:Biopolymer transport protein ExbD n=3 Tax=Pseudomonas TaxID=286 RepID=A0ABM7CXW9_9PSED|nr:MULTISPECIES: TonB system transport protein ExbD [Pseudomonas]AZL71283.1 TonB system transport protein ExbD [Pseudomonas oryziphila]AZL76318.1 TonB system transport protein ExbD [Pseudomonas oryziphila]MDH0730725.1 TonB system transport protein ExbD [Pseudomonas sichuanensis]MDH1582972.1 TonB system transport protein ExbD [Pseudomonas sichuanensis]MDH1592288.1 TonB system transport protein ExbD [Pseudomonas sichuanensis]